MTIVDCDPEAGHGTARLAQRGIGRTWVISALARPDWVDQDPDHPFRRSSFRAVPAYGHRVLRVVVERAGDDLVLATAHVTGALLEVSGGFRSVD
jgi:Domain of unknown function (DUF4258)